MCVHLGQAYASVPPVSECGANTQVTLMVRQPSKWHCSTCVILPGHGTEAQGWVPGIPLSSVTVRSPTLLNQCQLIAHKFRVEILFLISFPTASQKLMHGGKHWIIFYLNFLDVIFHLWRDRIYRVYQILILLVVDEEPYTTYKIFEKIKKTLWWEVSQVPLATTRP